MCLLIPWWCALSEEMAALTLEVVPGPLPPLHAQGRKLPRTQLVISEYSPILPDPVSTLQSVFTVTSFLLIRCCTAIVCGRCKVQGARCKVQGARCKMQDANTCSCLKKTTNWLRLLRESSYALVDLRN